MTPDITFVCCVEAGSLEAQTVRMVESLRRFGGRYARAPLMAVTPRFGPPLSRKTLQLFERHEVEHLVVRPNGTGSRYSWNSYVNKPHALLTVEERARTAAISWLDSDLLVVGEPEDLELRGDESFLACTSDQIGATTGPGDALEPYWAAVCAQLGIDLEALPWVTTEVERARVRYYFNSGVFVYRRTSGLAARFLDNCIRILDGHISSKSCGFFFTDQVALGLTAFQMRLPWRALPYSHNYHMGPATHDTWYREDALRAARVVHYHDAMWPGFWSIFLSCFDATHPAVARWLRQWGPMRNEASLLSRALGRVLKEMRGKQSAAYTQSCSVL